MFTTETWRYEKELQPNTTANSTTRNNLPNHYYNSFESLGGISVVLGGT